MIKSPIQFVYAGIWDFLDLWPKPGESYKFSSVRPYVRQLRDFSQDVNGPEYEKSARFSAKLPLAQMWAKRVKDGLK